MMLRAYAIDHLQRLTFCFEYDLQVWSSLILYRKILDAVEDNDYDNLTKRAYVGRTDKLLMLPLAYTRSSQVPTWLISSKLLGAKNSF